MNATIQRWGNSQGVRLPKVILEQIGIHENDSVEITADDNKIILKKVAKPNHITLEERLETFYGKPLNMIDEIEQTEELDWGKPEGAEIW